MHSLGVSGNKIVNLMFLHIESHIAKLAAVAKDTLFVITADHGQVDVAGKVDFWRDEELCNMLLCPPYLDARTPCFRVKPQCKADFERLFTAKYNNDFILRKTDDLIEEGYFGPYGNKGFLLGDYIAIGTFTHKIFVGSEPYDDFSFAGHHTSTTEEMLVPLIMIKRP